MDTRARSMKIALYDELLKLLMDSLRESPDALELAEKLVNAYKERGSKGVREEIGRLINEVLSSATET